MWNLTNCKLRTDHIGHTGYLNTVTVSPDGSLCASGGKDGQAMLWDLNEGKVSDLLCCFGRLCAPAPANRRCAAFCSTSTRWRRASALRA